MSQNVFSDESYRLVGIAIELWKAKKGELPAFEKKTWRKYLDEAENLLLDADAKIESWKQEARFEEACNYRVSFDDLLQQQKPSGKESRAIGKITRITALKKKVIEVFPSQKVYDEIFNVLVSRSSWDLSDRVPFSIVLHPAVEIALKNLGQEAGEYQKPYLNRWASHCLSSLEIYGGGHFPHCADNLGKIRGAEKIVDEQAVTFAELETLKLACSASVAARKGQRKQ